MDPLEKVSFGALLLFVASIPNEAIFIMENFGSASRFAGGILFILWITNVVARNKIFKPPSLFWVLVIFVIFSLSSTLWTLAPDLTYQRNITLTQLTLFLYIMVTLVKSSKTRLQTVWFAYVIGALITAIVMLHMFLKGEVSEIWRGYERFAAFDQDPNTVAVMLSAGLLMCIFLYEDLKYRIGRYFCVIVFVLILSSVLLTGSRGGFITAFGVIIYPVISRNYSIIKKIVLTGLLLAVLILLFNYLPQTITGRFMLSIEELQSGYLDTTQRQKYWIAGMKIFPEAPILGHGASSFKEIILKEPDIIEGKVAHNVPIQIAVDYGIIGIILLFLPLLLILKRLKNNPDMFQKVASLIFIWFLGAMALSYEAQKITWFIFGISICAVSIADKYNIHKRIKVSDIYIVENKNRDCIINYS